MAGTALSPQRGNNAATVRILIAALVLGTLVVGTLAIGLVRRNAVRDHDGEELRTSQLAVQALSEVAVQIVSELRGANGLVRESGVVDSVSFGAFAADVVSGSVFASVAREAVVTSSERRDFEERNRLQIVERDTSGTFVRSPERARYLPVVDVWPINDTTSQLFGFDIASDPTRNAAILLASAQGLPTISAPVALAPSDDTGYFVVQPLYRNATARSAEDIVGFVSAAFPAKTLIDRVLAVLPPGCRMAVTDGTFVGASDPPPRTSAVSEGSFGGRPVRVAVELPGGPVWAPTVLVAIVLFVFLIGLLAAIVLTKRIARDGQRAALLADLARELAATHSTAEAYEVLQSSSGAVLGATSVAVLHSDHAATSINDTQSGLAQLVPLRSSDGKTLAMLEVNWPSRSYPSRSRQSIVNTVADVAAQALDRASRVEEEADRSSDLAILARELAAGSSTDDLTLTLLEKASSVVGSALVQFGLIDGEWLTIRSKERDDATVATRRVSLAVRTPMTTAIQSGAPVLLEDAAAFETQFADVARASSQPWLGARAALPLRRSDGGIFGAIGFGWGKSISYTRALRATITTVVDLAGQSLERSEFTDRQTRAALTLATFAQQLAAANNHRDVEVAVEIRLRAMLRAHHVELLYPNGSSLLDLDAIRAIATHGRTAVISEGAAVDALRGVDTNARAVGVVPIREAEGSPVASIVIVWRSPMVASEALIAMLDTIGNMVGQTVERTRLYELERGLVRDLQAELLRPLTSAPGLDAAAVYEPASRSIDIGGDWYSAVRLTDHRMAFVIGDVFGHGVEAVAAMGRIQSVMIGLLTSLPQPEQVFARASELIRDDGSTLASALLAIIDTESRTLEYLSAGHPPALLRTPSEVLVLEGARQSLLGLRLKPTPMERMAFPVGSTLVMYTDGLVERRTEDLDDGIARLRGLLRSADKDLDARALGASLLEGCRESPDARRDDIAIVVVRSVAY